MAVVEPYAPCPCGSGEKFKWCCQKVESFAERAQRLAENGQVDAALGALDEGLRKSPGNAWLAARKALLLSRREQYGPAADLLRDVVRRTPQHVGIQGMLVRLALQADGPTAGAGQLQQALTALKPEQRPALSLTAELVGSLLADSGHVPGGLAHLELADALTPDGEESTAAQTLRMVESNPSISPWLRNPYELSDAPEGLDPARLRRFEEALDWADRGLWASAAAAFDSLSAEQTPEADRNLGLCRLFLGDDAGAVEALRRHTGWVGADDDTVDLEALCQLSTPMPDDQMVDLVQWIWPLRDREALRAALRAEARVVDDGPAPLDPEDPESPEVDGFVLIDRPRAEASSVGGPEDLPRVDGRLLVGRELLVLEGFDDGRLEGLAERVRGLAGEAIPPAHPRTKVVGQASRPGLALRIEWVLPEGLDRELMARLSREERERVLHRVWPETAHPGLGGRTPRQAVRDGGAELALRAALVQVEQDNELAGEGIDLAPLRRDLGVPAEPAIDPASVDIDALHLARLHRVDPSKLDDNRLIALFQRAHRYTMPLAIERAARALVDRPSLLDREGGPSRYIVFGDLANIALGRGDSTGAFDWVRRGRESDPADRRPANAPRWDLLELRLRSRSESPETWVPELAALLDRYRDSDAARPHLLSTLVEMGLLRMAPNPDNPGDVLLDSRPLQAVLARFGPRITTAGGQLGVSASRGGIWTPDQERAGAGTVWSPGTAPADPAAPAADKPRLIIPGR